MSKNLENEYKELMTKDVPDLWDRIESELEPKQQEDEKINWWRKYYIPGASVAACLCILVIASVIFKQGIDMNKSMSGSSHSAKSDAAINGFVEGEKSDGDAAYKNEQVFEDSQGLANDQELGAAQAVEENVETYTIKAKITGISENESGMIYTVQIEESDNVKFSAGDNIGLYDENGLERELVEGESYFFDISASTDVNGEMQYLINSIAMIQS